MPVQVFEYTPVRASRGRRVHAVAINAPNKTACGRKFTGWKVATARLNCRGCKLAILKGRLGLEVRADVS